MLSILIKKVKEMNEKENFNLKLIFLFAFFFLLSFLVPSSLPLKHGNLSCLKNQKRTYRKALVRQNRARKQKETCIIAIKIHNQELYNRCASARPVIFHSSCFDLSKLLDCSRI